MSNQSNQIQVQFEPAIIYTLRNEDYTMGGKITVEPDGSLARYGINSAQHPEIDISSLTPEKAEEVYRAQYWDPFHFDILPSQQLATKVFDTGVNIGPRAAIRMLQSAALMGEFNQDGILDKGTLIAVKRISVPTLLKAFCQLQANHYRDRAAEAVKLGKSYPLAGLLARAEKLPAEDPS